jgi:hypothetical protein
LPTPIKSQTALPKPLLNTPNVLQSPEASTRDNKLISENIDKNEQIGKVNKTNNFPINRGQQPFIRPVRKRESHSNSTSKSYNNQTSIQNPASNRPNNESYFR